jgi:hypothetical protein
MAPLVAPERHAMRSFHQVVAVLLVFAVATYPTAAHASLFGEENGPLTVLVAQGVAELSQAADSFKAVTETLDNAKEYLQIARDVYAGINEFTNFDPEAFLQDQAQYFLAQVPIAGEVSSFVSDVSGNGLNGGHFNANDLYGKFDAYRDAYRRRQAQQAVGANLTPFDSKTALSISGDAERALSNPSTRQQLAGRPDIASASEGLFSADAARVDPKLLSLYMQRRAAAKEAEYQAFKLYSESLGASPGKAQQLAAMATAMTAQEIARIDDKLAQSVSLQQLDRQEAAIGKATERREADFLWNDVQGAAEETFKAPKRGNSSEWKELP